MRLNNRSESHDSSSQSGLPLCEFGSMHSSLDQIQPLPKGDSKGLLPPNMTPRSWVRPPQATLFSRRGCRIRGESPLFSLDNLEHKYCDVKLTTIDLSYIR